MYQPSEEILYKYAKVLLNFALNSGKGVKKGEVVFLRIRESAKPFLLPLQKVILESGAHMLLHYSPEGVNKAYYNQASDEQLTFQAKPYLLGRLETIDHLVAILSENDKHELEGVDSKKIMMAQKAMKYYSEAMDVKENKGKFTWTLGLFGTQAMADEAGLTLEQYWKEIINACYLNEKDPVSKWKELFKSIQLTINKLNKLKICCVHITGKDVDLTIKIGQKRKWVGGSGRNIPSFEIFTSPDWRGTNGWIKFNQPLYYHSTLITDIELEFKDGIVVKSKASKNQKVLKDMIKVENADKLGEFSMTDSRYSRITKFMAETLYDENVGGKFGNTHIALGRSYQDTFDGNPAKVTKAQWKKMGFNDSSVHTDVISTTDRVVEATLDDGRKMIIYKDGKFCV